MNNDAKWILLDTETTGLVKPVFAVDLAAQKMRSWERDGDPFRRLLNHCCAIPPEASRAHGYTREILERDGNLPAEICEMFGRVRIRFCWWLPSPLNGSLSTEWITKDSRLLPIKRSITIAESR